MGLIFLRTSPNRCYPLRVSSLSKLPLSIVGACILFASCESNNWAGARFFRSDSESCTLEARAWCAEAQLAHSSLVRMNLAGIDLSHANLVGADLSGTNLRGANLAGADLAGARLVGADLSEADLSGASIPNCEATDAKFVNTNFTGASFGGQYAGADFSGATFDKASDMNCRGNAPTGRGPNPCPVEDIPRWEGARLTCPDGAQAASCKEHMLVP